jgi:exodeoxyribonuclease-3
MSVADRRGARRVLRRRPRSGTVPAMRIATWNVNGLRARLDFVMHWLRERQPDVVGLQELKLEDDQVPGLSFESEGYRIVSHGQKAWNGVAILSREPAEVTQRGLPGEEGFGSRLITASVAGIDFTTVYVPNGKTLEHDDYPRKLQWLESLAAHWRERHSDSDAAVLCGDFNVCPAAIDSWHEDPARIFHTDEERTRFARLLDGGLVDLFRERYPDEQKFSWWDYRMGAFHRNMGLRIDLILGTRPLLERTRDIWVDRDYRKKKDGLTASDHAPVIADLD